MEIGLIWHYIADYFHSQSL